MFGSKKNAESGHPKMMAGVLERKKKKEKGGDGYGPSRWFVAYACCRRSSFIRLDDRCSTPKTDITLIDWRVDERAT